MKLPSDMREIVKDFIEFLIEKKLEIRENPLETNKLYFNLTKGGIQVSERAMSIAQARTVWVRLYHQVTRRAPRGLKGISKRDFAKAYNLGEYPELSAILGKTSWQTLERWRKEIKEVGDPIVLAPRWGEHRRGKSKISNEQKQILLLCQSKYKNDSAREVIRKAKKIMDKEGIENNCTIRTYGRFLQKEI